MGLAAFNLKRRKLAAEAEAAKAQAAAATLTPTPPPAENLNPEPLKPATETSTAGNGAGSQTLVSTNGGPAEKPAVTTSSTGGAPASEQQPAGESQPAPASNPVTQPTDPNAVPPAITGERPAGADAGTQISGATADGSTVPPALSDADRIAAISEMTIPEIIEAVKAGKFTREEAAQLEAAGKNRQTLIKRLTETLD